MWGFNFKFPDIFLEHFRHTIYIACIIVDSNRISQTMAVQVND
jgi:hypothetical protein